ncbi:hypothetical protein GCM10010123_38930 [Pilimelia anulata]|uniref:IPT/TIG domain-containing protein n=1 Tax=Pilimelia anulata TaxID=53371 RepID=A0A8J3B9H7_9ACTN|nr:hypothetical protein [Pilimelia anulata]GGK05283.1 hypothetical protein GCM10010123_38930 [Pilimelia anulata]
MSRAHGADRPARQGRRTLIGLLLGLLAAAALGQPAAAAPAGPPTGGATTATAAAAPGRSTTAARPASPVRSAKPARPDDARPPAGAAPCTADLTLGQPLRCTLDSGERHTHSFTLGAAGRLIGRVDTDAVLDAAILGPDGREVCRLGGETTLDCAADSAGRYAVVVTEQARRRSAVEYTVLVDALGRPACPAPAAANLAFEGPVTRASLAAGALGTCHALDLPTGTVLRSASVADGGDDVDGVLVDSRGAVQCRIFRADDCALTGVGPFRAVAYQRWSGPAEVTLRLRRLTAPTGCRALAVAPFGDPGGAVLRGRGAPDEPVCATVAAAAGPHLVRQAGDRHHWRLYDEAGAGRCASDDACALAAGRYTLVLRPAGGGAAWDHQAAVVALGAECATTADLSWAAAARTVRPAWPGQVDCTSFAGAAGDRIAIGRTGAAGLTTSVIDAAGGTVCPPARRRGADGPCVLPAAGRFRVLSHWEPPGRGGAYLVDVRRLNAPTGCPDLAPGTFGAPPSAGQPAVRCRRVAIPAAGPYVLRATADDADGIRPEALRVYDDAGELVCDRAVCPLPAGALTLVPGSESIIDPRPWQAVHVPLGAAGCAPVPADGLQQPARRGDLGSGRQVDCQALPYAADQAVQALQPPTGGTPDLAVVDAGGRVVCDNRTVRASCPLSGAAPFRMLATGAAGAYATAVFRRDAPGTCPALAAGEFGKDTGAVVNLAADRFTACLTVPAGGHSTGEVLTSTGVTDAAGAVAHLLDPAGSEVCRVAPDQWVDCALPDAGAHTVVVRGDLGKRSVRITRKDVTAGAKGCTAVPPTALGAATAGKTGTPGSPVCHQVSTRAGERLWFDTRDAKKRTRLRVFPASGVALTADGCGQGRLPCQATGSASYRVLVAGLPGTPAGEAYQLDAWQLARDDQSAPACTAVPSIGFGFAAVTGTLDAKRQGNCLNTRALAGDRLDVTVTGGAVPVMSTTTGALPCGAADGGRYECAVPDGTPAGPALLVLYAGDDTATRTYRAEGTCTTVLCGGEVFGVTAATPAAVRPGPVTLTITGSALHAGDDVAVVGADDAFPAQVKSVESDRRRATVTVDLTRAAPGSYRLDHQSVTGRSASLPITVAGR